MQPAPILAIVVPAADRRARESAVLLVESLGFPQLTVVAEDQPFPDHAFAAISFPGTQQGQRLPTFGLVNGTRPADDEELHLPLTPSRRVPLRRSVSYSRGFSPYGVEASLAASFAPIFFWAVRIANKSRAQTGIEERASWAGLLLAALSVSPNDTRWDEVVAIAAKADLLAPGIGPANWRQDGIEAVRSAMQAELARLSAEDEGFGRVIQTLRVDARRDGRRLLAIAPHIIPWLVHVALENDRREAACAFLDAIVETLQTSGGLASVALGNLMCGRLDVAQENLQRLFGEEWRTSRSAFLRHSPKRPGAERSIVLPAAIAAALITQTDRPLIESWTPARTLSWQVFENGTFFDREGQRISVSMLENWLALQQAEELDQGHIRRGDAAFDFSIVALELQWKVIVEAIFAKFTRPLVRLNPWPSGSRAAIAIRYDVDRDASDEQIATTLAIQAAYLGGVGAAWYFLEGAVHNEHVSGALEGRGQEFGVHTRLAEDARAGQGGNAHGGTESASWTGAAYLRAAAAARAAYTETVAGNILLPRRGWSDSGMIDVWVTPPYHPLEATIDEHTTAHFDARLDAFRLRIELGGLAIIGTHPDCDQGNLRRVLAREDLGGIYPIRLIDAVTRVRALYGYGSIRVGLAAGGGAALQASTDVHGAAGEVIFPDGSRRQFAVDLRSDASAAILNEKHLG